MDYGREQWQWSLRVVIFHGPAFGHRLELTTHTKGRTPLVQSMGLWKGFGVPESLVTGARARLDSVFVEHLLDRYGVAGELPFKWSGEPDPF
jgi:hypothetical protein